MGRGEMLSDRNDYIQIWRFGAALLVLVTHVTFYAEERIGSGLGVWHFGEIGVPIFFVISGIVMMLASQRLGLDASGAQTFLARRFLRIVPLYWLATAAKVAIALAVPGVVIHNPFRWDHAVQSFLFIPYFNTAGDMSPMHAVGWTLLHEVYFYLLFAAALACRRSPVVWVSLVLLAGWAVGYVVEVTSAVMTLVCSPANLNFLLGMAVGWVLTRAGWRPVMLSGLGIASVALAAATLGWGAGLVVAFAASVPLFRSPKLPSALRPLIRLGDSSYSLYLSHPFVAPACVIVLGTHVGLPLEAVIALSCVLAIVAGHVVHLRIERPLIDRVRSALGGLAHEARAPLARPR
jgi:exopolysaccharide production protein ExoZ